MAKIRYPNLRQKIDILNLIFQTPFGYDFLHIFIGYSKRQSPVVEALPFVFNY